MIKFLRCFCSSKSGATSIEYALVAIGVALAIIVALGLIGASLDGTFRNVAGGITAGG